MSGPVDPEIQAIKKIVQALCKLDPEARRRALGFVLSREATSANADYFLSWLPRQEQKP